MEGDARPPVGGAAVGRRAVLGLAAASVAALATACTSANTAGGTSSSPPLTGTTGSGPPPFQVGTALSASDLALVDAARRQEASALRQCRQIARRYPHLRGQLQVFEDVLATHVATFTSMLTDPPPVPASDAGIPPRAAARAEVWAVATELARKRTRDCHRSDSGGLAAVFAAAAASHRAVVAGEEPG